MMPGIPSPRCTGVPPPRFDGLCAYIINCHPRLNPSTRGRLSPDILFIIINLDISVIMPAKTRGDRSAAPSASPAPKSTRSRSTRSGNTADSDSTEDSTGEPSVPTVTEDTAEEEAAEAGDAGEVQEEDGADAEAEAGVSAKSSMSDRMEKMKELRNRMVSDALSPYPRLGRHMSHTPLFPLLEPIHRCEPT